ncbi:Z1 domain-containing protein [Sphingobacterium multivorum]|uniref:Z1 domain-containing protein n=1 Tax=Sphingobacterium multivorum TaxID=28454 RepID=UPI0028AF4C56|nr:Z1 domain-containing protein [Sphingobacterium multivorum]
MDFKNIFEERLIEIKEKQNNRLFLRNLDELKVEYEDFYTGFQSMALNKGIHIEDYDEFFKGFTRYVRGSYTFLHDEFESDEEIRKFDPLDGTWLRTSNLMDHFEQDKRLKAAAPKTRWGRFLYFLNKVKGFSIETTTSIANSSLDVIARCHNPQSPSEDFRKGMVVGSVQSGKTTNFNAVINAAYDVGFNMVIVLTGITEDLRVQTQTRLNMDLGICENEVGVNLIVNDDSLNVKTISTLTSQREDFNAAAVDSGYNIGNQLTLIVSKKNKDNLLNIYRFLKEKVDGKIIDVKNFDLLIVDDEADNATLNGVGHKKENSETTAINGLMRGILGLFKKKTYVAYTATPFANILQDANLEGIWNYANREQKYQLELSKNLYPENFVRLLDPPANYIGPKYFFDVDPNIQDNFDFLIKIISDTEDHFPERFDREGDHPVKLVLDEDEFSEEEDLIEVYGDFANYRKKTRSPKSSDSKSITSIPHSLKDAILSFILTIAVRKIRSERDPKLNEMQRHNTMLIHISRFSNWQNRIKLLLTDDNHNGYLDQVLMKLGMDNKGEGIYSDFERVWNYYYSDIVGNLNGVMKNFYYDPYIQKEDLNNIFRVLPSIARDGIAVMSINTTTKNNDILDYNGKVGKNYIAIGGNRLSRGFTLEGLSISYFTRATGYADAILQMGRWFGYRPGYLDCCRLFSDSSSHRKFSECVSILYDLEKDIKQHMADVVSDPKKIVNRIKATSGEFIKITRPNILRNSDLAYFSFSNKLVQTYRFDLNKDGQLISWKNFLDFFEKYKANIEKIDKSMSSLKLTVTDFDIVKELINTSTLVNKSVDKERLFAFIEKQRKENEYLKSWDVIFVNGEGSRGKASTVSVGGIDFKTVTRSGPKKESKYYKALLEEGYYSVRKAMIISPKDMSLGLSSEVIADVEFRNKHLKTTPEHAFRHEYGKYRGVVLVYLIDTESVLTTDELKDKWQMDLKIPIVSFAVGIADLDIDPEVFYLMPREVAEAEIAEENNEEVEEVV